MRKAFEIGGLGCRLVLVVSGIVVIVMGTTTCGPYPHILKGEGSTAVGGQCDEAHAAGSSLALQDLHCD